MWFTGLPAAGKSTLSLAVYNRLLERGISNVEVLDSEAVRPYLASELGFSKEDRDTNVRRIAWVANLLNKHGIHVLVAAISPYRSTRNEIRRMLGDAFIEVFVSCPVEECERRDPKGLYKKARAGEIHQFTGVSDRYETPENPEIVIETDRMDVEEGVRRVMAWLERHLFIPKLLLRDESSGEKHSLRPSRGAGAYQLMGYRGSR